jgi:hypothetical protein
MTCRKRAHSCQLCRSLVIVLNLNLSVVFFIFSFFYTFDCRYINLSNTIIIYFLSIKVKKGILEPQTIESNKIKPTFPDSENDEQLDLTHACILHIFKLAFIYNFAS